MKTLIIKKKYFSKSHFSAPHDVDTLWHIPITYISKRHAHDLKPKFWMPKVRQYEILIDDLRPDSHLIVNVDRMGYYRVQYDEANWMLIANELSRADSKISTITRAMLMNDAAVFLAANTLRARLFLELMKHLEHDVGYSMWL